MKHVLWAFSLALALLLPTAASAARVYVGVNLTLRAGPDVAYPAVTVIPAGTWVMVDGCTQDWYWCDVAIGPNRGWVAADYLQFEYGDRVVYVNDYGMHLGVPIVTFVLGTYWNNHYRSRPWYHHRDRWVHRNLPLRRPPPRRPGFRPTRPLHPGGHRPPARPGGSHRPPSRPTGDHRPPSRPAQSHRPANRPSQRRPVNRPSQHRPSGKPIRQKKKDRDRDHRDGHH